MGNPLPQFIKRCHDILMHSKDSEVTIAREYLSGRNITEKSFIDHRLGYCPKGENIPDEIGFYGKNPELLKPNDKGYFYFIQGRVIVPVHAEFGEAVGLATRKPSSEKENTWWNLPRPFYKGTHLFLLNLARQKIFENNKIYLVEGYIDGILLYQENLRVVCSLMGTALTSRKIGLIARYCNNICLCLDADQNQSGQKAQNKAIFSLKEFGFCESLSVIDLPIGVDPDVFVTKNGLEAFLANERQLKPKEISNICYKIRQWGKRQTKS